MTSELNNKTVEQLKEDLLNLFKTQFALRMQHTTGQLAKTSELKRVRREIARVKTILAHKGVKA